MEDGEVIAQSNWQPNNMDWSKPNMSNKRSNSNQGGKGGGLNSHLLSPTKSRKIVNSFEKLPQEYIKNANRTTSGPMWRKESIRYRGNEEQLILLAKIEDKTSFLHDCEAKEMAYHQLVVDNYYLPEDEQGFTTKFRTEALGILFPSLDIHDAERWGACLSLLMLRTAGFDEYASHPLLPNMTKVIDSTNKGSYIQYRLMCLNEDTLPLEINQWKDMPGNALAKQALNFSIWSAYDSRNDTSHIEYERVLHRFKFIHPSNSSYSLWNTSANINRDRSPCNHVHMCRNPWYSIIQEYKYIAEAKRILWNEDLRKEEQERVKTLKDVYADICQFKRACDIKSCCYNTRFI